MDVKGFAASRTSRSGEVAKEKRRRFEPLGESGIKVAEGRPAAVDDLKEVEERSRLVALHGEKDTSKMVDHLVKEIWLGIEEEKFELKKGKIELEKKLARASTDVLKEAKLVCHLMLKGYSKEKVQAIKADTYVEEVDEDEVKIVGVVDVLDGVSHRTVLDNQGDDNKLPEADNEKVELDSARSREDGVRECNREFAKELDRMREVKEKDAKIGKELKELAEMTEHAAKPQSWVDALMAKSKSAEMA
ncbi:hypothetical protein GIB67_001500 [Kingdonia uniflora]|uniref:Uncharacterized protein n=1 Tax=Kingdonia uniflora TaxID=39325 RepID=A0A7J7MNR2_9MAGN|nr:hypothetical protein GIB67_001500 [Kingdonia uniflora]